MTQLRKDAEFTSTDKYPANVRMSGEIGSIAGCRVVPSKKVPLVEVGSGKIKCYACPIIKLEADHDNEDEVPALTIYRKRAVNVETEAQTQDPHHRDHSGRILRCRAFQRGQGGAGKVQGLRCI